MDPSIMADGRSRITPLLAVGLVAFLVAGLSIVDMYLPRPYDGVVLDDRAEGRLVVRQVVPGSGAELAGIEPGDEVLGIARSAIRSAPHAASLVNQNEIGESVPYLIRAAGGELREVDIEMGRRQIGDSAYLYACLLGFSFFFIGLFVLLHQPGMRANQLFYLLCSLFLLFLICRLRPASYSWVDVFVLNAGTAALLFLPPLFLHFFLIFPLPIWEGGGSLRFLAEPRTRRIWLTALYLAPVVCFGLIGLPGQGKLSLISGAPAASWWVLAVSILLGLTALVVNYRRLPASRQRQGAAIVFLGSVLGLIPFVVLAVAFSSILESDKFIFYGVVPLILFPLAFAYAIIRFQLLNIQVILRKSLLYTLTTALVTIFYAVGIASFNGLFRGSRIASSPYFPILFALTIVLLFEPLRRRIQVPVDRFFFARRSRLQTAMVEMGEAFTAELDPTVVVRELVERLPRLLELRDAALYLVRGDRLERVAGPETLPKSLPVLPGLNRALREQNALAAIDQLGSVRLSSPDVDAMMTALFDEGIQLIGEIATPRRVIGLVLFSGRDSRISLEADELRLMRGLLHQAAIALETGMLLDDRARQAELERELEIAAAIQSSLLPDRLTLGEGWRITAVCRPARQVGGDFFAEIPGPLPGTRAVVYGDVSGKSVSGALMMMAAKEALHSLASLDPDPEQLFCAANKRLYELGNRSFVALGYFAGSDGGKLQYMLAGQPQPMKRFADGHIEELALGEHRLPLGAMNNGHRHLALETSVGAGELIVAYSDGVIEAQSPGGEFFGAQRLTRVLRDCPAEPEIVIQRVLQALEVFTDGHQPYDDVTLLAIARGAEESHA